MVLYKRWSLIDIKSVDSEENFRISAHTTYGLGGVAKRAYFPKNLVEAVAVYDYVTKNFDKYFILGNGSNILASESYYDGAIICTLKLCGITYEDGILTCLSGMTVKQILKFCTDEGLTGLEYLAGIPATVGGLTAMNGGVNDKHIGDNVVSVSVYNGNTVNFNQNQCQFGYKHSIMRDINALILSVSLSCDNASRATVKNRIDKYMMYRRRQPKGKSCGCVFKNYNGISAGKLIEDSGLKGLSYGGARVSYAHANFIINYGNNSDDVFNLINIVKNKVYNKFGVKLEEEVVYIGKFNETDS